MEIFIQHLKDDNIQLCIAILDKESIDNDQFNFGLTSIIGRIFLKNKQSKNIQIVLEKLILLIDKKQKLINLEEILFYINGELKEQMKIVQMTQRTRDVVKQILIAIVNQQSIQEFVNISLQEDCPQKSTQLLNQLFQAHSIFQNCNVIIDYKIFHYQILQCVIEEIIKQQKSYDVVLQYTIDKIIMSGYLLQYTQQTLQYFQQKKENEFNILINNIKTNSRKLKIIYALFNSSEQQSNDNNQLFKCILDQLDEHQLLQYIQHNDLKSFGIIKYLINYIKTNKNQPQVDQYIQTLVQQWGSNNFILENNYKQQIFVTNMIIQLTDLYTENNKQMLENNLQWLSKGISNRLNYEQQQKQSYANEIIYKSGVMIWKKVGQIMGSFGQEKDKDYDLKEKMGFIMSHQPEFTLQDYKETPKQEEEPIPTPPTEKEEEEEEEEEKKEVDILEEDKIMNQFYRPRHLYDALLGLQQTDNRKRYISSLNYIPIILNQQLPENALYIQSITSALLTMNPNLYMIIGDEGSEDEITTLRQSSLIACLITDLTLYSLLINRINGDLCSLADRHMLLQVIHNTAHTLSNHLIQHTAQDKDISAEQEFFFQKGKTFYYDSEQIRVQQIAQDRQQRIDNKSTRKITRSSLSSIYVPTQTITTNKLNEVLPGVLLPLIALMRADNKNTQKEAKEKETKINTLQYLTNNPALLTQLLSVISHTIKLSRNSIYLASCLLQLVPVMTQLLTTLHSQSFIRNIVYLFHQIVNLTCKPNTLITTYTTLQQQMVVFVQKTQDNSQNMDISTRILMTNAVKTLMEQVQPQI